MFDRRRWMPLILLTFVILFMAFMPGPAKPVLAPADFGDLPGWSDDAVADALPALQASCRVFARRPDAWPVGPEGRGGRAADWRDACAAVQAFLDGADQGDGAARAVIEAEFRPWRMQRPDGSDGLFTGYYAPVLAGSETRTDDFPHAILRRPDDLVMAHTRDFPTLQSLQTRFAGRVQDGTLIPYFSRAEIMDGALDDQGLELVWLASPIDGFFLEIQGSGIIETPDGQRFGVGYAAQNGHPYTAIGRPLIDMGAIPAEQMSLQAIRQWLEANPARAQEVMNLNASYVFFERRDGTEAIGAQGTALTPGRSLAVDRSLWPLGAPVWIDVAAPPALADRQDRVQRLMVAQDTGGAITGPVRGDVYWGAGPQAEQIAGGMASRGDAWILLPRAWQPGEDG